MLPQTDRHSLRQHSSAEIGVLGRRAMYWQRLPIVLYTIEQVRTIWKIYEYLFDIFSTHGYALFSDKHNAMVGDKLN